MRRPVSSLTQRSSSGKGQATSALMWPNPEPVPTWDQCYNFLDIFVETKLLAFVLKLQHYYNTGNFDSKYSGYAHMPNLFLQESWRLPS
jgi:hypothetical protein